MRKEKKLVTDKPSFDYEAVESPASADNPLFQPKLFRILKL